jgi:hypothetical protein
MALLFTSYKHLLNKNNKIHNEYAVSVTAPLYHHQEYNVP